MSTLYYESELYHHGIHGQKWGKRNGPPYPLGSGSKSSGEKKASNYSDQQRKRDTRIYGKGAEKRINKKMLKGESVQSARHAEVVRQNRIASGKSIAKKVATGALVVGGAAAVTKILQTNGIGSNVAGEVMSGQVTDIGKSIISAILKR